MYKHLKGEYNEGSRDFSAVPKTKQHQRHRLADRKVPLNIKQCFFPVWMTEQWNRLPKEVMDFPSLEIFKNLTGFGLNNLLWMPYLSRGMGLDDI